LSVEINLQAYRVMHQVALWAVEYKDVMMDGIDELPKSWFRALREIEKEKFKVAKAYNRSDEDMWRLIIVYAHLLFHTQQMAPLFDFRARSYGHFIGRCPRCYWAVGD
jgi:hypothetical protein